MVSGSPEPPGAQRGGGRTRREIANAALIRHRQRPQPRNIQGAPYDVWVRWLAWQLEWENAILRYRDGNNDAERTEDELRRHDFWCKHT